MEISVLLASKGFTRFTDELLTVGYKRLPLDGIFFCRRDFQMKDESLCCWPCVTIWGWWWSPLSASSVCWGGVIKKNTLLLLLSLLRSPVTLQRSSDIFNFTASFNKSCCSVNKNIQIKHKMSRRFFNHDITFSPAWGVIQRNSTITSVVLWTLTFGYSLSHVFVNGSMAAFSVHVETGWQTLLSREMHLICVLWSQMKLCMRALALWTCLSNFHFSQGVVFTSISGDIWSVIRE